MGTSRSAIGKPASPATPEAPPAAADAPVLETSLVDDFLLFLDDSFPALSGDGKLGKEEEVEGQEEEEEEEEELEWLSNVDAFPPLDTSLTFGPTSVSTASAALEELETKVAEGLGPDLLIELRIEEIGVPRKRRSSVPRPQRQVFSKFPFLQADESKGEKRQCTHCMVEHTPQWRQGPAGPGTLCNACGVRYKSGRLYDEYRPANSPTFSPGRHSNFHRKVLEMREGKQTDGVVALGRRGGRRLKHVGGGWRGEVHAGGGLGT